jgi:hypothetical protein
VINPEANVGSAGKMCRLHLFDENKKYEDAQWREEGCKVLHKKYKTRANLKSFARVPYLFGLSCSLSVPGILIVWTRARRIF